MVPFDQLADGVYRRRYAHLDLNVGVIVGEAGVAVVDTRASHREAGELREELGRLTNQPVVAVINTHYHWDHVWGNARFGGVPIHGHVRCRTFLEQSGEMMRQTVMENCVERAAEYAEVETVPPDRTFEAVARIDLGTVELHLSYHGRAHTDSDIVVAVPAAGVTFMGDLIEEGAPPQFGSSFPSEWPNTLAAIEPDLPPVVVPGHGDVVDAGFVAEQRSQLEQVAATLTETPAAALQPPPGPFPAETMAQVWARYLGLQSQVDGASR